jgi:PAS domain S-box-containing protein
MDSSVENNSLFEQQQISSYDSAAGAFFRMNPDLLCIISFQGIILNINPAWEAATGFLPHELITRSVSEIIHPDDLKTILDILGNQNSEAETFMMTNRIICKNGVVKRVEWHGRFDRNNGMIFASLREALNQELRESEEKFRTLILNMGEGVGVMSKDEVFLMANPSAELIFGMGPGELTGASLNKFITPETSERIRQETLKRTTGMTSTYELEIVLSGGETKDILVTASPLFEGSQFSGTLGIFRDITERKKQELLIKQQNEELHLINSEKDKFFSIIAHDLRSPFNAFLNLTAMMESDFQNMSREAIYEYNHVMNVSAKKLFRLLENLLDWSRMQRGMIKVQAQPVLLASEVQSVTGLMSEMAHKKRIALKYQIPDDLVVLADENMLRGIIRNLVSNAIKFTPSGGTVEITARYLSENEIVVSVMDTGIGMRPQMVEDLFRLEANISRPGTDGEPSTGLGLVLCREFAERNGGKLWVESEEMKGSVFSFSIPRAIDQQVLTLHGTEAVKADPELLKSLNILIVDDDMASRMVLVHNLKKEGHQVMQAPSGLAALEIMKANELVDLVLMDIRMPGMDGYEATRQIRLFNTKVVIIIQSTLYSEDAREIALRHGCNDFIAKPVVMEELLVMLMRHFPR